MDFQDSISTLEKVVPESGDSAASWRTGRASQSMAAKRGALQTMFPMRIHHLIMAAMLLTTSILLIIASFTLNYDLCVKVTPTEEMKLIGRYIQPSDRSSGFPQVIANLMATSVISMSIICFYRWTSYPRVPVGIQKSIDHVNEEPPEVVQLMCKTFFMDLINIEVVNIILYFLLTIFFTFLALTDAYLPEKIFWPNSVDDFKSMEAPSFCFIGFGIFGWFKPVIIGIVGGFATMCTVSMINLYQDYLHLKRNEKMAVAGINEYADGQNSAILLNVRFSNMNGNQGDGIHQRSKGVESIYIPAVEELNNSDVRASDMKTV